MVDYFAGDFRTNHERMLAGDLYISDDPDIAREQQRAVGLSAEYQAAYVRDIEQARPILAGTAALVALDVRPSASARTARSARTSNC